MPDSVHKLYSRRIELSTSKRDIMHRMWGRMGNLRLAAAILAIVGGWQEWQNPAVVWKVMLLIGIFAFLSLGFEQRKFRVAREMLDRHILVNQRALARLEHRWGDLPIPPDSGADRTHPYAHDLNIVSTASIAQRISTPSTDHGWNALYESLLKDRDLSDLTDRQAAVQELSKEIELRQLVEIEAVQAEEVPDSSPLTRWALQSDWLRHRPWLRWLSLIGPVLVLIAVVLVALDVYPWPIILIPITLNAVVFMLAGGPAAAQVQAIVPMREPLGGYGRIMRRISEPSPVAPKLRDIDEQLTGAHRAMRRLSRIVNFSIPPGSMLYFPLQMVFMWDINVLDRLEAWRGEHGAQVQGWMDAMGEWEALAALSVLTHDHPEWSTPVVGDSAAGIAADTMAHPLIDPAIAVANDVEIRPAGTFLFVTGSNMSGKSTLLRALGVNVVLAQAGANVCAHAMILPPLRISSCMRVEDSLAHGVSFFMAELLRLKAVIDRVQSGDDRMSLYLLDEILQGTNTAERQIASRHILQQLSTMNAIGAVSSHDLELIGETSLQESAISVHFAEQFARTNGEPDMTFDYRLRPGIATSSNAIRLMELIGFDIHE